ncbi:YihY/virulence factor BrkB family protein [Paenibacillus silviterrae]|uniref:YihY/virulence factor BrkB family protein n=1 Tax=Paenibacillus silviterrae TaxID=3242194 RepID=UPI0025429F43|nr:YihY/virulence factor BrkB family protein [Paenibacillus chinjuensis]
MGASFLRELAKQLDQDDVFGLAAQCAYYFLLSLFPFLLFIVSLLGYLPITTEDVLGLAREYIPQGVASGVEGHLSSVLDVQRGGTLSFGLILSLVSASAAMNAIVFAVNKAYGLPERRSFIHSRFLSIMLTIGMLVVVASALLLSVFGHFLGDLSHEYLSLSMDQVKLWNVLRWFINLLILFLVFLGIYYIAPNTCLGCKDVLPGAVFSAMGWQLISEGFSFYVNHWGNYSATYGGLGGVIALLTWFYLCALIIIVGGEINAMSYLFKKKKTA